MPLINLHNSYFSKVTEIQTVQLYRELNIGRLARGVEGGRRPSTLSHFIFPRWVVARKQNKWVPLT